MQNLRLLRNRLRVSLEKTLQTAGGIHLPDGSNDANLGTAKLFRVLDVGPGRRLENGEVLPMEVCAGDRVLCFSYTTGGRPLDDGSLIIDESVVLAVFPKEAHEKESSVQP